MAHLIDLDSVVRASGSQISTSIGDDVVILELGAGVYFSLDGVGPAIWKLVQQPVRVRDLRDSIVRDFDVDAETCQGDLLALLRDMCDRRIIDVLPS